MATIDPVIVKIQADVSELKNGLAQAEQTLKGLDDSVKKADSGFATFTTRLKQVGATLGATFAASQVVSFFKESVAAAAEAEAAQNRLRTILLNTNGATEEQIVALHEQAKALEQVGVVSADNVTITQSQLATFDLAGSTINSLTPAILNYVTAEKGAAASADDFRSMTNGLAQALNGQFGSLTRIGFVLDDATKKTIASGTESERAAALVKVLNSTYDGFNESLRKTSEGIKQVAINDFNNLKQEIGEGLQPVVDGFNKFLSNTLFPTIQKFVRLLVDNKDTIVAVSKVLFAGVAAFTAYKVAVTIASGVSQAYGVIMTLLRGQQLASIASTNGLAASMARLNAVMKANPIGVVITVVTALSAAIVALWKNSETFRNIVISAGKAGLQAFASIIPMVAQAFEAISKLVLGPLRALLTALSKLPGVGKYAKAGLDIMNKGLNGISDMGKKAADKANELTKKLDGLAKSAKKAGEDTKKAVEDPFKGDTKGDKGGGLTDKEKSKLDKYKDDVKEIYKDMNDVIAEAGENAQEALNRRNERMQEARDRHAEVVAQLEKRHKEALEEAEERHGEIIAEAKERKRKAEEEARKRFAKTEVEAVKEYNRRKQELELAQSNKILELQRNAETKRQEIVAKGQAKLAEIVEKGRERLRSAWESGTEFSLKDLFGSAKESGASILDTLRNQLTKTTTFQKELSGLVGQGYEQTFIEQIAKAGPEAGMAMLEEIKKLSPDQQAELQKMYSALEDINQAGMDKVAETLSTSTKFATDELAQMYLDTQNEITSALAEVNKELNENVAEAKATYTAALTEAARLRDEKIAEASAALTEALAEAEANLQEAIAEADKALSKARQEADKRLKEGLAEAQKDLQKALEDAQKDYEKAIDEINKATQKKLDDLMDKLAKVAATIKSLGQAEAAASALTNAPKYQPIVADTSDTLLSGKNGLVSNTTIKQTFNNTTTSAYDVQRAAVSGVRYGQAVRIGIGFGRMEQRIE